MTIEKIRELVAANGVPEAIRLYVLLKNFAIARKLIKPGEVFATQQAIDELKKLFESLKQNL